MKHITEVLDEFYKDLLIKTESNEWTIQKKKWAIKKVNDIK